MLVRSWACGRVSGSSYVPLVSIVPRQLFSLSCVGVSHRVCPSNVLRVPFVCPSCARESLRLAAALRPVARFRMICPGDYSGDSSSQPKYLGGQVSYSPATEEYKHPGFESSQGFTPPQVRTASACMHRSQTVARHPPLRPSTSVYVHRGTDEPPWPTLVDMHLTRSRHTGCAEIGGQCMAV